MQPNNCGPEAIRPEPTPEELRCPKCRVEMEPIESSVEGLPIHELQLCPSCYLVIWRDAAGFQVRQGVPMKGFP
jgi:uncharacterized protein with PIN domain